MSEEKGLVERFFPGRKTERDALPQNFPIRGEEADLSIEDGEEGVEGEVPLPGVSETSPPATRRPGLSRRRN